MHLALLLEPALLEDGRSIRLDLGGTPIELGATDASAFVAPAGGLSLAAGEAGRPGVLASAALGPRDPAAA